LSLRRNFFADKGPLVLVRLVPNPFVTQPTVVAGDAKVIAIKKIIRAKPRGSHEEK
jgi:hypothetical protein